MASGISPDSIVFTTELVRGGGWHGRHANDNKSALLSGQIVASTDLPTEEPEPGEVVWADGSTTGVTLFSAAEALADMIREFGGGSPCQGCWTIEVTGARLTEGVRETTRGPATVPVWEFELAPRNEPLEPVTYAAVDYPVDLPALEGRYGEPLFYAVGTRDSRQLTVAFLGSPETGESWCGADYSADAIETQHGVVVLIRGERHPPADSTPPAACLAVGATRTAVATLAEPLGDREVLDLRTGLPISVLAGPPSQ